MRSPFSVTRRSIEFLFGTCKVSAPFFTRSEDMQSLFNREETVVTPSYQLGLMEGYRLGRKSDAESEALFRELLVQYGEGDHLLPPSDESKVGEDV